MLSADRLTLAIDIQSRSYRLLRWVAEGVEKGFIAATRAHEYADVSDAAFDWIDEHYLNLPSQMRPERRHLREFANFFGTYVTSSFDFIEQPGTRLYSHCGCYCPLCTRLVNAPHLQPKKLSKRDKRRATDLMVDRVRALALEEGLALGSDEAANIVQNRETRRSAGYSAYGYWLIKRTDGFSDGKSILALWREIAWQPTGSPISGFKLQFKDFVDAEEELIALMQNASPSS